jgi:flagellar hook-length control protein FliK
MTPDRTAATEALTSQPPPGRPPARGRQEGKGDPFGTVLDQHQARTADAEGHEVKSGGAESAPKSDKRTADGARRTAHGAHGTEHTAQDSDPQAAAAVQSSVIAAVPATPVVAQPADGVSISQVAGQVAQATPQQQPVAVAAPVQLAATSTAPVVTGPAVPVKPATPAPQAAAAAAPQAPATPAPVAAAPEQAEATPATPVAPKPAPADAGKAEAKAPAIRDLAPATSPRAAAPAEPKPAQHAADPAPNQDAPAHAPAPAPTPAPATGQPQPTQQSAIGNQQPAPPQAAPAPPAPAPATPSTPAAPAVPGARLEQAVETVHQVIRISQSNGITQARVQLHPEELGSIDIHLRSTPDGVVARVVADASQAAAVLRDGGDELRRQLASQGINLTHFDVGTAGGEQHEAAFGNGGSHGQRRDPRAANPDNAPIDNTEETTTVALPNGVLVDVLA